MQVTCLARSFDAENRFLGGSNNFVVAGRVIIRKSEVFNMALRLVATELDPPMYRSEPRALARVLSWAKVSSVAVGCGGRYAETMRVLPARSIS